MPSRFVFKKCQVKKCCEENQTEEFLVVLEKPEYVDESKPFVCNESRIFFDTKFVKFRCNGLIPRLIVSLKTLKLHDHVLHYTEACSAHTDYKIDQLVTPSSFDTNLDHVCAPGVHYFLNAQEAVDYELVKF